MTVIFLGFVRDKEMRREKEGGGGSGWAVDCGGGSFWVLAGDTDGGSQGSSSEMEREIIESLGFKEREGDVKRQGVIQMGKGSLGFIFKPDDDIMADVSKDPLQEMVVC